MSESNSSSDSFASSTGHDLASADWADAHFLAMQPEYGEMLGWVGIQPNWHVLDAGCGAGGFLPIMAELVGCGGKVSALDLAPENVSAVAERVKQSNWLAPVEARVGSLLNLPYTDNSFDTIWCANTTQYLTDDELATVFQEFRRVLRRGGLIAIKEYDITAMQMQPTKPMLCVHLHEALCRLGNLQSCNGFRMLDYPRWLRDLGLIELRQKPTMIARFQPLRPVERQFICALLEYYASQAEQADLPKDELQIWRTLANSESSDHIVHHPDFQYRCIQTVFVGRIP